MAGIADARSKSPSGDFMRDYTKSLCGRLTEGIPRRGVDLIQDWRTEEVRHGSTNPVEAGL